MRAHPIGTGPFKCVEFKPHEAIKLVKNPDYWKPGRPYLDGIEFTIVPNRSTAMLAFSTGRFDLTWPYDVALGPDRKAFNEILDEGQGGIGGAMLPPPDGVWGLPPDRLTALPGYGPAGEKNSARAR